MELIYKVYAYVTLGSHLLVFRHIGFPEAGIQVPGGTVESNEQPEGAVLREAYEETGLTGLSLLLSLGYHDLDIASDGMVRVHRRYFYHLACQPGAPDTWQHYETHPSDGSLDPILFDFFWIPASQAATVLHPYYTEKIAALLDHLEGGHS